MDLVQLTNITISDLIQKANDLLDSTNEKIVKLSATTQDAQDAILDGDSEKLQRINSEIQHLLILLQSFTQASWKLTQKKIKATNGDLLQLGFSFGIAPYTKGESLKSIVYQ